jgi:hypothetical protein
MRFPAREEIFERRGTSQSMQILRRQRIGLSKKERACLSKMRATFYCFPVSMATNPTSSTV